VVSCGCDAGDLSSFRTRPEALWLQRRRSASPHMPRRCWLPGASHPTRRRRIFARGWGPHHLPTVEMPDPSSIRRSSARPFPASPPAGRRAGLKTSGLQSDVAPAARGIQCSARTAAACGHRSSLSSPLVLTSRNACHLRPVAMPDKDAAARARVRCGHCLRLSCVRVHKGGDKPAFQCAGYELS
jgi:hypothetical protein